MSLNLVIRADANSIVGTGHLMRCMALAQGWNDCVGQVTFLSHCESENLHKRIRSEGFNFQPIEFAHPDPCDLNRTISILSDLTKPNHSTKNTWLILDGYHFTPDYQKALRTDIYNLLVLDDMVHLNHYHADILLNQNIHAPKLKYPCDKETIKLLGCDYALLRREFLRYRNWRRHTQRRAKKILVTLGGVDPDNVTLKVVKALSLIDDPGLEIKIVVGPSNPNINSLKAALSHLPLNCNLLFNVSDMPSLMAWADVAVSAAGSTCWELAFMGLPGLIITIADNQVEIAKGLGRAGAMIDLGWHENISIEQLAKTLNIILQSHLKRATLSEKGQKLVDGMGGKKIIRAMVEHQT
jgi:UDP-2,4-diacetamido-2,4,6-trideoxy-beta-L-altropyranose hydrolase